MIDLRRTRAVVVFCLLLSVACGSGWAADIVTPAAPAAEAADEKNCNPTAIPVHPSLSAQIDKGELLGHVKFLSAPELRGREAGSAEQLKAARYVADEFARYGLQPLGENENGQPTYFQNFELKTSKGASQSCALKLNSGGREKSFALKTEFAPFPSALEKTNGKGGVAFAGYGIMAPEYEYDDFGELDLAGKWALLLRYEPQEHDEKSKFAGKDHTRHAGLSSKIYNCAMRRAAGVLIVTGPAGRGFRRLHAENGPRP